MIEGILQKFQVDLDRDIFSLTRDGASVMVKLGKDCGVPFHLLCHAHGLHLAVGDLLYRKKKGVDAEEERTCP